MSAPRYRWQPTTSAIAQRFGIPASQVVRFDQNTSPFPTDWAPAVVTPVARGLNEYPEADYRSLREAAGRYAGVVPNAVVPTAGVDELLLIAARAFLEPGERAVAVTPTYALYRIATAQRRAELVEVPLDEDLSFPTEAFLRTAATARLVWLCIPNNPTGNRPDADLLAELCEATDGVVLLDAAYAEIAGDDWVPWLERHPNLVVGQTLSKGFGLAGARVGYALAGPDLADALDAVRPPGSISSISAALAVAALDEPNRMRRRVARLVAERARFAAELDRLGLEVHPSEANFLLCRVGPHAGQVAGALLAEGLVVRTFPDHGPLAHHLRFTVRAPEETARLVDALWRHLP